MEEKFWHDRWQNNQIPFHKVEVNPLLVRNLPALELASGARVFVPLCGKSLDVHWLLAQGYRVAGAELSRIAVEQLFAELGVIPDRSRSWARSPGLRRTGSWCSREASSTYARPVRAGGCGIRPRRASGPARADAGPVCSACHAADGLRSAAAGVLRVRPGVHGRTAVFGGGAEVRRRYEEAFACGCWSEWKARGCAGFVRRWTLCGR